MKTVRSSFRTSLAPLAARASHAPRVVFLALFLWAGLQVSACAAQTHWKHESLGDWFIATNWTNNLVPNSSTDGIIANGGTALLNASGAQTLGLFIGIPTSAGSTGTLLLTAVGSTTGHLTVDDLIYIGSANTAGQVGNGTLTISAGADLVQNAGGIFVGRGPQGSTGNLTVTGPGSTLSAPSLTIGSETSHGNLRIENAGSLLTTDGALAATAGSDGTATVTGANSRWALSNFSAGYAGNGSFTISNGGAVSSLSSTLAALPGSTGTGTVTGAGSSWTSGNLFVGGRDGGSGASVNGGSGILRIQNGGLVRAANLKFFNNGALEVENGSSLVPGLIIYGNTTPIPDGGTLGDMVVGNTTGGRMEITTEESQGLGGKLYNHRGFIGQNSGSDGAALVTGSRSRWITTGSIWAGNSGNGTLEIRNAAAVRTSGNFYIGFSTGSAGSVIVNGSSELSVAGNLYVGGNGGAPGGQGVLRAENFTLIQAATTTVYNTGFLQLGVNAPNFFLGSLTFLGGFIQTTDNIAFTKSFTLGTGGVFLQTGGFNSTFSGNLSGPGGLTKFFLGSAGTLTLTGSNTYTGATAVDAGTLLVNGSITSATTVNNGGTFGGSGTVGAVTVNSGGTVAPGTSIGRLTINGAYNQTGSGKLAIELGGSMPGTGFDQLAVSGQAIVGGTLNVTLINGFRPKVGDTFAIITSSSETGNFSTINSPGFSVRPDASPSGIVLTILGIDPLPLVENNNDDGPGSLRFVIANASAGNTIIFAPNVRGAINLTSGELLINKNLKINGPGANVLTVQRSAAAGTQNFRIFSIASASVTATISGLSIANGNTSGSGGGISNSGGTVAIVSSTISGNRASNGGGIFSNFGAITIKHSTISENTVSSSFSAGSGGGIFNSGGMLTIDTSTISGNTALGPGGNSDSGGGIITNVGTVNLTNSTITGNSGDIGGGLRNINGGTVRARNTIIALNTSPSGPDLNGPLTSEGYNLIGNNKDATITPTTGDQIGTDALRIDPLLDTLKDNGGPTRTHALLSGSPAIDQGYAINAAATSLSFSDQRGFTRPVDQSSIVDAVYADDIGAFEFGALPLRVISITRSGSDIVVTFADAAAEATYRLERKLALADAMWESPLAGASDFTANQNGEGQLIHPGGGAVPNAFYRVRLLP